MLDAQHGYAVGCANYDPLTDTCPGGGGIYRTTDGVNWVPLQSFAASELMDLHIFSMDDVYAIEWAGTLWHYNGQTPLQTATPMPTATPTATDDADRNTDRDRHTDRHIHGDAHLHTQPDADGHADHRRDRRRRLQRPEP